MYLVFKYICKKYLVFKYICKKYLVFKYILSTYLVFKYILSMYLVFKYKKVFSAQLWLATSRRNGKSWTEAARPLFPCQTSGLAATKLQRFISGQTARVTWQKRPGRQGLKNTRMTGPLKYGNCRFQNVHKKYRSKRKARNCIFYVKSILSTSSTGSCLKTGQHSIFVIIRKLKN